MAVTMTTSTNTTDPMIKPICHPASVLELLDDDDGASSVDGALGAGELLPGVSFASGHKSRTITYNLHL